MPTQAESSFTPGRGAWGLLLALALVWGPSFFLNKIALQSLPPMTIVMLRVGLAALALNVILGLKGSHLPGLRDSEGRRLWAAFLGMGLLNNLVPFCLIVWGQTQIASSLAAILNATTPISTLLIAHWMTPDEKMTGGKFAGILLGFTGVVVMIGPGALQGWDGPLLAKLAVLGATVSYGCAGVFGRRFKAMGVTPFLTATGQLSASTLLLLPLTLMVDRPWVLPLPGLGTIAALLGLALVSTALAYLLYFRILAVAGAVHLLLVAFLMPVIAILLGVLVLGEQLALTHILGMAMLGVGLGAIDGRPMNYVKRGLALALTQNPAPHPPLGEGAADPITQAAGLSGMR